MKLKLWRRKIIFFWQRLTRGWDDSETWNIDIEVAKFALPRIRKYRQLTCAYQGDSPEHWDWILGEIEWYLETVINCYNIPVSDNYADELAAKLAKYEMIRFEQAEKAWQTYFTALWF